MNAAQLIEQVHAAGGRVEAKGDTLKLAAPKPLPDSLMEELRQHKGELLAHLIAQRHGLTLADLKQAAGLDWNEIKGNRVLFESFAAAVAVRRMRELGIVPAHYTATTTCANCGPVLIFSGVPARVLSCPWCLNRKAGTPVPRAKP